MVTTRASVATREETQRPLRVLFDIAEGSLVWGGLEEHICVLGRHLAAAGHEPLILLRADFAEDRIERLEASNIRVLRSPHVLTRDGRHPPLHQWIGAYRALVRRERVDVAHLHSNLHGNELWAAAAARLASARAVVCTYHFTLGPQSPQRRLGMWGMHGMLGAHGIAVSAEIYRMVRHAYRPPAARLTCIVNGMDEVTSYVPLTTTAPGTPVKMAIICRLAKEKGVDVFLNALARVDPALPLHVTVMGDGDERERLMRQTEALDLGSRVHFMGYVADAARLLPKFDLVVLPSRGEGFPLVAIEACAAGRPIIATKLGGLVELMQTDTCGWLVDPDDTSALTRTLEAATRDANTRRAYGAAGRHLFETQLRAHVMVEKTLSVYRAALELPPVLAAASASVAGLEHTVGPAAESMHSVTSLPGVTQRSS